MMSDMMVDMWMAEFAAANAIIDTLCEHLVRIGDRGAQRYRHVLDAIRRRRAAWSPFNHVQGYHTIPDVIAHLNRVSMTDCDPEPKEMAVEGRGRDHQLKEEKGGGNDDVDDDRHHDHITKDDDDPHQDHITNDDDDPHQDHITNDDDDRPGGDISTEQKQSTIQDESRGPAAIAAADHSFAESASEENILIIPEEDDSAARTERLKNFKRFVAKESVKGHMVNVVRGLKVYENVLTDVELSRLDAFINGRLLVAGRKGELKGDTYILFNKQLKGNKKEIIQLGVPVFQPTAQESTGNIEPIPPILQDLINHLVQWRLIAEDRKPNSCIINFFGENDHSQPYLKPPHLQNPISTLVLRETKMAFGRVLVSDQHGDFKGSLRLPLKEGSLLVMRGHSSEMARHVVRPSPKPRVSIAFAKVRVGCREPCGQSQQSQAVAATFPTPTAAPIGIVTTPCPCPWGMGMAQPQPQGPVVLVRPPQPQGNAMNPPTTRTGSAGTGVFLPWTMGPRRHVRQLPPRIQKRKLPAVDTQQMQASSFALSQSE